MNNKPNINTVLNNLINNSLHLYEVIISSIDSPIKTINGEDLFYFISKFGSEFTDVRNPHGAFTLKINSLNKTPLFILPLYKENLTNFTVAHENNLNFTTDLFIMSDQNIFIKHNITPIQTINNFVLNSNIFENILNDFNFIPEIKELPYELMKLNKYRQFEFTLDSI